MPHSERIKSAYLRSTALCVAVGCAVPGAMELDGRVARKPKYAKISRMESVCHGAAISRRGVGVGACVCAGVVGLSVMRSTKIHERVDYYVGTRRELRESFGSQELSRTANECEGFVAAVFRPPSFRGVTPMAH